MPKCVHHFLQFISYIACEFPLIDQENLCYYNLHYYIIINMLFILCIIKLNLTDVAKKNMVAQKAKMCILIIAENGMTQVKYNYLKGPIS